MKTQDWICGDIKVAGKKVADITGNYMGFIDFNKVRYWDIREQEKVWFPIVKLESEETLASDASKRLDSLTLRNGTSEEA